MVGHSYVYIKVCNNHYQHNYKYIWDGKEEQQKSSLRTLFHSHWAPLTLDKVHSAHRIRSYAYVYAVLTALSYYTLDDYYSSLALFAELREKGFGECGTVRVNKQGLQPEMETGVLVALDASMIPWADKRQDFNPIFLCDVHNFVQEFVTIHLLLCIMQSVLVQS